MPDSRWEWKFNPSNVLAIVLAAGTGIAGFVRVEGRTDSNAHHISDLSATMEKVSDAVTLAEKNNAVLVRWQQEQDRRLDRLEEGAG